ncbi:MAG: flagellar basal body L-ring protein FlgH [Phycisphaerales bacterium]|nr:flagellar basal body L-ring protein FlgH [Phycisphaerales bacterium]
MNASPWITMSARVALALLVLGLAAPALAQRNSLFGGPAPEGPRPSPTTQPARGPGGTKEHATWQASLAAERIKPRPNGTLLRVSPFAVEVPEPEKVKVHDLVTIIVRESKSATTDGKMESNKNWSFDTELSKWIRLSGVAGLVPAQFPEGNPAALFDFKNKYGGDGKYDRKDELTTRVTARVVDVKPNGNLVLEASKVIEIDEEGFTITLTGECRAIDITPQNTVLSTQMAAPEIKVKHAGIVRDATRRGWLMRGLDLFRPF